VNLSIVPSSRPADVIVGQSGKRHRRHPIPPPQNGTKCPQPSHSDITVGQKWRYTTRMAHNDENSPLERWAKLGKSPQTGQRCGPLTRMTHDEVPTGHQAAEPGPTTIRPQPGGGRREPRPPRCQRFGIASAHPGFSRRLASPLSCHPIGRHDRLVLNRAFLPVRQPANSLGRGPGHAARRADLRPIRRKSGGLGPSGRSPARGTQAGPVCRAAGE